MLIGYARVSTLDQSLGMQLDALGQAGCDKIYSDTTSGARSERPGLREALDYLREGDCLVVWRLDRLGRSLRHLIETVTALDRRGVLFRSLTESIDTTTPSGRLVFHLFGALAEFERELIRERVRAGVAAARARGRCGGRPRKLSQRQAELARTMLADPTTTITEVARALGVSRSTLYRALATAGAASGQCGQVVG